jgi:hypothetical protein
MEKTMPIITNPSEFLKNAKEARTAPRTIDMIVKIESGMAALTDLCLAEELVAAFGVMIATTALNTADAIGSRRRDERRADALTIVQAIAAVAAAAVRDYPELAPPHSAAKAATPLN